MQAVFHELVFKPFPRTDGLSATRLIYATRFGAFNCCAGCRLHRHDYFELTWLRRGPAVFYCDFQHYTLAGGTLIFSAPGQLHTWLLEAPDVELVVIAFHPEAFAAAGQNIDTLLLRLPFYQPEHAPYLVFEGARLAAIDHLFTTALARSADADDGLLMAYLNVVLAEAQAACASELPAGPLGAPTRLTRAYRLALEKHFHERRSIKEYAHMLGVTPNHLVETIRQTLGVTPGKLLHDRLLLEARRLLIHTDRSVHEIAEVLSFASASQFGRWFKTRTGISPGQFRRTFQTP